MAKPKYIAKETISYGEKTIEPGDELPSMSQKALKQLLDAGAAYDMNAGIKYAVQEPPKNPPGGGSGAPT
jgi:hypothetical protein